MSYMGYKEDSIEVETVQAWLNKVDEETLADTYFAAFPIDYMMIANQALTLGKIRCRSKERFLEFVRRMKQIEVPSDDDPCVFFACKQYVDGFSKVGAAMCRLSDVYGDGQPECYAWSLTDFAQVMGYFMAETRLTLKNINAVLAEILHEMSFFGYRQEDLEAEREKLLKAEQEIAEGKYCSAEEAFARLEEELGLEPLEPDPEAEEKERAIQVAGYEYDLFCRNREIEQVKKLVCVLDPGQSFAAGLADPNAE